MESCTTAMWMKFFTDSGIPKSIAANYAVVFVENRMTRNMLLDLNKEILRDMDIHVVGDVIAILKHAKVVYAQMTREKVYQNEPSVVSVSPLTQAQFPSTAATTNISKVERVDIPSPQVRRAVGSNALKRKRTGTLQSNCPVAKKTAVRRVLPEHEGPYKISMPSGSTPKTRKILAQMSGKESVFERLGSDTSDTTVSTTKNLTVETPVARAGIKRLPASKPTTFEATSSSVFQRLGPGKNGGANAEVDETPTVTSSSTSPSVNKRVVLQPDRIKTTVSTSKVSLIPKNRLGPKVVATSRVDKTLRSANTASPTRITVTMAAPLRQAKSATVVRFAAAPRTGTQGILGKSRDSISATKSIYSRLGDKEPKVETAVHAVRTLTKVGKIGVGAAKSSVFRRLGPPALDG